VREHGLTVRKIANRGEAFMALIVASIPGRVRIRHRALARSGQLGRLRAALAALEGVEAVEARTDAASLIVRYDAARVSVARMERRIDAVVDAELAALRGKESRMAKRNRQAKYVMLVSLFASLALAAGGARRAHALTGTLFVAALGLHLWRHREHLLD
jgi:hypothetical protein